MNLNRSSKIALVALLVARNFLAVAQTTNALAPAEYPKFIATRNIFDPNRLPNVPSAPRQRTAPPAPVVRQLDAFSLVGIIGYGEGRMAGVYAFFDGTSADYRRTAQLDDTIANFKITGIAADSVTLMLDTNSTIILKIGEQLHNDGIGHWLSASGADARYSSAAFGNGRNGGRSGFGNGGRGGFGNGGGRRRNNNNFGNGNNGGFNAGGFNRGGNNFGGPAAASDNSQADDPGMNSQDVSAAPDDNTAPDNSAAPPNDNTAPDTGN